MKRFVDVHTGEVMAGRDEVILKSETNQACLVIAAYDSAKKVGALAHAMFSGGMKKNISLMRDAAGAIDEMLEDMTLLGSQKEDIKVCLVTGENVPHKDHDPNYDAKLSSTIELLKQKHIEVTENSVVDAGKSHIIFDVSSGQISYI